MRVLLILGILAGFASAADIREKRQAVDFGALPGLSLINMVRFPNDPCDASDDRNGTCLTSKYELTDICIYVKRSPFRARM